MQNSKIEREIIHSWERCQHLGVEKTKNAQFLCYENKERAQRIVKQTKLITSFKKCLSEIQDIMPAGHIMLLTDSEGYLLFFKKFRLLSENKPKLMWELGTCFGEESLGTNAVDLALRLQKPVYFEPRFHYLNIFTDCYCYAIPLTRKGKLKGCFALFSVGHRIEKEMICVAKLLAISVKQEIGDLHKKSAFKDLLTKRQLKVLELLAQGMTSHATALELELSENTIKYHRKRIFEKLEVQSMTEAVAKAAQMGLLLISSD